MEDKTDTMEDSLWITACEMADDVDFLTAGERLWYARALFASMMWGKAVK